MTEGRTWWLAALGGVGFLVGLGRLLLDVNTTVLGTSVSCGNALGWIITTDDGTSLRYASVCGAPLHNASLEGGAAVVIGAVLFLAWLIAVRAVWPLTALVVILVLAGGVTLGYVPASLLVALAIVACVGTWRVLVHLRRRHAT